MVKEDRINVIFPEVNTMPSITETKCREHVSYVLARGTTMTSRITYPLYTLICVRHSTAFA